MRRRTWRSRNVRAKHRERRAHVVQNMRCIPTSAGEREKKGAEREKRGEKEAAGVSRMLFAYRNSRRWKRDRARAPRCAPRAGGSGSQKLRGALVGVNYRKVQPSKIHCSCARTRLEIASLKHENYCPRGVLARYGAASVLSPLPRRAPRCPRALPHGISQLSPRLISRRRV